MGRANLAKYRSTSATDTKPVCFPKRALWTLHLIQGLQNTIICQAVVSIRDAATQRGQLSAVKVLGVQLRNAHLVTNTSRRTSCPCLTSGNEPNDQKPVQICVLAGSVLAGILFDSPDATPGLVSAALRAVSRSEVTIEEVRQAFVLFYSRIEKSSLHSKTVYGAQFMTHVADLCLVSVIAADLDFRDQILRNEVRTRGCICSIRDIVRMYELTTNFDNSFTAMKERESNHLDAENQRIVNNANRKLLENACDYGLKAAQTILNSLSKDWKVDDNRNAIYELVSCMKEFIMSCEGILRMRYSPRNCALASAASYVNGIILVSSAVDDMDIILSVLRSKIFSTLSSYPPFSQLCLLRSIIESPIAASAHPIVLFPDRDEPFRGDSNTIFEQLVLLTREEADANIRAQAMDAVIVCIRRCKPKKLGPECRETVMSLIYERWHDTFPGTTSQIRKTMEALVEADGNDEESTKYWVNLTELLVKKSSDLKGIYPPLRVLVRRVGALRFLKIHPLCQSKAIEAASADPRLTKPVADWFIAFWKVLRGECMSGQLSFTHVACPPLVEALIHVSKPVRETVTEHILPVFFRDINKSLVKELANALLTNLREKHIVGKTRHIGAAIMIISAARFHGVFLGSFSDPKIHHLLNEALRSGDSDIRSAAFDMIVTCRALTEPISSEEIDLVLTYLPIALMPNLSASDHSRFRHSMRRFFQRIAACRHAAKDGSGGWWMKERRNRYNGFRTSEFESNRKSLLLRLQRFEDACFSMLLAHGFPGARFQRRASAIELMILLSKSLSLERAFAVFPSPRSLIAGMASGLLDAWERPRQSTLDLLVSFDPFALAGLTLEDAADLQGFALPLFRSAINREVDAAGHIFQVVFRTCVLSNSSFKDRPRQCSTENINASALKFPSDINELPFVTNSQLPGIDYANSVLNSLESKMQESKSAFDKSCETGLFYGHFLLLKYILRDYPWKLVSFQTEGDKICSFLRRYVQLGWECVRIALRGVSYQALGSFCNDEVSNDETEQLELQFKDERKQIQSTSCFHTLKEICTGLGIMSNEVPFQAHGEHDVVYPCLLNLSDLKQVGDILIYIIKNTRHWGVVDGASEGFHLLCERLLGSPNAEFRLLPKTWSLNLISDALIGNLYVLRRSAGVPSILNSILSAEATTNQRSLEAPLLTGIVTALLEHLMSSHLFVDEDLVQEDRSKQEVAVSHALNLLRSFFLNAKIAKNVLKHFEAATIWCVKGFRSSSWLIRNSSMMLFSALVRRGIGVPMQQKLHSDSEHVSENLAPSGVDSSKNCLRSVTAFQFFTRYPKLHPFLLNQLEISVEKEKNHNAGDPPSLFPTLFLLTYLSPGAAEDPNNAISMEKFRDVLLRCLRWKSEYVRRTAAAAIASLIEDENSASKLLNRILLTSVPVEPEFISHRNFNTCAGANIENGKHDGGPTRALYQNELHGSLLAADALLEVIRKNKKPATMVDAVKGTSALLPERLWIATNFEKNPCNYTRAAMLDILWKIYEIAVFVKDLKMDDKEAFKCSESIMNLNMEVLNALEVEPRPFRKELLIGAPAVYQALKKMSSFAAQQIVLHANKIADVLRAYENYIDHPYRELRNHHVESCSLLMRELLKSTAEKETYSIISEEIRSLIISAWRKTQELLRVEKNTSLVLVALRFQLLLLKTGAKNVVPKPQGVSTWTVNDFSHAIECARSFHFPPVRNFALCVLGSSIPLANEWDELVTIWRALLRDAARSASTDTRIAVCESIALSRSSPNENAHSCLYEVQADCLFLLTKLMQDEHSDVVNHATRSWQLYFFSQPHESLTCLPALKLTYCRLADNYGKSKALLAEYVRLFVTEEEDRQVDKMVSSLLFSLLGTGDEEMGNSDLDQYWITERNSIARCSTTNEDELVSESRRPQLFELEGTESDREILMSLQLMAYCLNRAVSNASRINELTSHRGLSVCLKLKEVIRERLEKEQKVHSRRSVLGPASFTEDGFIILYKMILKLYMSICWVQSSMKGEKSNELHALGLSIRADIEEVWSNGGQHPTLGMAMNGICSLIDGNNGVYELGGHQQVLFLLTHSSGA